MILFEEPTLEVSKDGDRETNSLGAGVNKGGEKQDGETGGRGAVWLKCARPGLKVCGREG